MVYLRMVLKATSLFLIGYKLQAGCGWAVHYLYGYSVHGFWQYMAFRNTGRHAYYIIINNGKSFIWPKTIIATIMLYDDEGD